MNFILKSSPCIIASALSVILAGCQTNSGSYPGSSGGFSIATPSAYDIRTDSRAALNDLYASNSAARRLGQISGAVLVFPHITKGGFVVGGQYGNGTLFFRNGRVGGYYNTVAASYGLQAGIQKFGYALFIMDNNAVRRLNQSGGWEIGSSPSLVVVDEGLSRSMSTTTLTEGVYAFFFNQTGLMAGLGLQGSKITRIYP